MCMKVSKMLVGECVEIMQLFTYTDWSLIGMGNILCLKGFLKQTLKANQCIVSALIRIEDRGFAKRQIEKVFCNLLGPIHGNKLVLRHVTEKGLRLWTILGMIGNSRRKSPTCFLPQKHSPTSAWC